ncbi:MAG: Rne/Rng family ribonuclease [Acidobacteria bacterium]|nr:Rne/Rng family ribonuclease [Acidobacteriota bacterium]
MIKELVISANRHETKLAVVEDDQLVEVYFQRSNEYSLAGSIHKGRVTRVLPGMQSAFVHVGLERDAFLYVSDFFEESDEEFDRIDDKGKRKPPLAAAQPTPAALPEPEAAAQPAASADAAPGGSPTQAPPAREQGDRENDRDRRGRRRRRRRGRGMPESKFTSLPEGEENRQDVASAEDDSATDPEPEPDPEPELEPLVLPGESIAKYTAAEAEPAVEEPEELAAPEPGDDAVSRAITEDEVADAAQEAAEAAADDWNPPLDESEEEPAVEIEDPGAGTNDQPDEPIEEASGEERIAEAREQPAARYPHPRGRKFRRRGRDGRPERAELRQEAPRPEQRPESRPEARDKDKDRDRPPVPSISDLLKEGQEIIVQVRKEPLGQKGARITSHIAMPGRYVVYMPTEDRSGVSRKISTDEERQRLKKIVLAQSQGLSGGFIVRTAGEGRTEAEIAADMKYLHDHWLDIRKRAEKRNAPCLLHHDLDLVTRTLRDQVNDNFKSIIVDNEDLYEKIVGFLERFQPALVPRVKLFQRDTPIFDFFNITSEMEKALRPKVWLKSGGYIVINQTEALVAIDINTGKFVGKSNRLEDTIVKTNLEAIKEIVRQVRLRDLGGIIVVDFIDMDERKNRQKVMQALEEAMRLDRAPYKILQFNDFGLVAITRRRVKQSLEKALCTSCPTCEGSGYVKSVQTVIGEILTEAHKIARAVEGNSVVLRAHPDVAKALKAQGANYIHEIEEVLGRTVLLKSDPLLHPEKFDLV